MLTDIEGYKPFDLITLIRKAMMIVSSEPHVPSRCPKGDIHRADVHAPLRLGDKILGRHGPRLGLPPTELVTLLDNVLRAVKQSPARDDVILLFHPLKVCPVLMSLGNSAFVF